MSIVTGPMSWLSMGSAADGSELASLPSVELDALAGTYAPEDADAILADFGLLALVDTLGPVRCLLDRLQLHDEVGEVAIAVGRGYHLARFKRGCFAGARLNGRTATIATATARSDFRMIGPVPRESSLFEHFVLEPLHRSAP